MYTVAVSLNGHAHMHLNQLLAAIWELPLPQNRCNCFWGHTPVMAHHRSQDGPPRCYARQVLLGLICGLDCTVFV